MYMKGICHQQSHCHNNLAEVLGCTPLGGPHSSRSRGTLWLVACYRQLQHHWSTGSSTIKHRGSQLAAPPPYNNPLTAGLVPQKVVQHFVVVLMVGMLVATLWASKARCGK